MSKLKIKAELDDEAFRVTEFIQELSKVQDEYFKKLVEKITEEKWVKGMSPKEIEEWLFEYCFNKGCDEEMFSEFVLRAAKVKKKYE